MSGTVSAPVPDYTYPAAITRIIDADTYDVEVQLGFRIVARLPLRLAHVDAPEHNTTAGQAAIVAVTRLLGPLPCPVLVHTFKPVDKYGRYLADVWCGETSIADYLLTIKLAVPYEGGTKVPLPVAPPYRPDAALIQDNWTGTGPREGGKG